MSHKIFRCFAVLFFVLVLSLSGFTPAQAAPPTNDNFANAQVITSLPFSTTVDNTDATTEPGEPNVCNFPSPSVWYSFTPSENMVIQVDMAGSEIGGISDIFFASGPTIADLTSLGCVANSSANAANIQVDAGKTYYIQVLSFGQSGAMHLNIQQLSPPANDSFSNAEAISSLPFTTSVDNTNASAEFGESQTCVFPFRSVWYSFSPSENTAIKIDMAGSPTSGGASVFLATGSTISDLTSLGCVFTGSANALNLQAEAGKTYYIRVDSPGQPGTLQVNITPLTPPANDNFANAEVITSLPFTASADNTNATAEFGEPQGCGFAFRSLWYSFTPAQNMAIQVDTIGSQISDVVNVFLASGPAISDLSSMGCAFSNTSTNLQLDAGKTYYIRVDSFGNVGVLQFNVQQLSAPANDRFDNAESVASLPFSSSQDNTNASAEFGEPQACSADFRSLWYSFTPTQDMLMQAVSPNGGTVSVFLASGPSISDLSLVNCGFGGNLSNFYVVAGETYYIRLDSFGQTGVLQLSLQQIVPPANDFFADAENISSLPFNATVDNSNATSESNEPPGCGSPVWTLWYSFTPAENTAARVSISGGPLGSAVDVYLASGPSISDLTSMGCASNGVPVNFQFEAGKTYYLRVATVGLPGVLQFDVQQITPPANDDFANAESIGSLPFNVNVDNSNATSEVGEPLNCASSRRTLWYSFTPAENMTVRLNTDGSTLSASVAAYLSTGPQFADQNFLTCTGGFSGYLQLEAGKTYYFQLDAFGQGGTIQFNLEKLNPPANDNLANAEVITAVPFQATIDITDALIEPNEPTSCYYMPNTVWYAFTPTETMALRADTLGSAISGNVNVYKSSGTGFQSLQFVACSGPSNSPIFVAEAGQTYYLQVGAAFNETGTINVNLVQSVPPANDNLANATAVSSIPFSGTANLLDATSESGEPQNCYSMFNTVWYSFTATETMKVRADTNGSAVNGNVNVYHAVGSGFPNLQFITCSGSGAIATFNVQAGEIYYFQVGAINEPGTVQLNLGTMPVLTGRVTDAVTGAPLPGDTTPFANVYLYQRCGDGCLTYANSQQADSQGRFAFDTFYYGAPLTPGDYEIQASAQLYQSHQFGPFTFGGVNLDVGDLPINPPAIIHGRAVDSKTGNPLEGASVTLLGCDSDNCFNYVNAQSTDSDGHFEFKSFYYGSPLTAGTYELVISAPHYDTLRTQVTISDAENRDLGDLLVHLTPLIGSISGRLIDAVTGQPISPTFTPTVSLHFCDQDGCFFPVSVAVNSDGTFRFEKDYAGDPLRIGTYEIDAFAQQYLEPAPVNVPNVGENENRNVGDIKLTSFPIRFTDIQPCADIPPSGGDCNFSVKLTNGTNRSISGKTWSMAYGYLPQSFYGFTNFQIKDPQDLDIARSKSQVFRFKLSIPANPGPYGTFICTQVFVGEGAEALLNTIGYRNLFCVTRNASGFAVASPQEAAAPAQSKAAAAATGTEVEPNNSCQTAQDLGAISDPVVMAGNLDSSQTPDIDFFRFTATPGTSVTIDYEGQATGKGTLYDPLLGYFDSNCNLYSSNDNDTGLNSHMEITVPQDGIVILAATANPDYGFSGGGSGSYQLTITPAQYLSSINGVITDAVSGKPLSGVADPFAYVYLIRCESGFGCFSMNSQNAGSDGSFHFETDYYGTPLLTGDYMLVVYAGQYQPKQTALFTVGKGENYNVGKVALQSFPVRFSDIQVCSVPSSGGLCDFSVKVTNGLATKFSGKAWSLINAGGIGSFVNYSNFQANSIRDVSLDRGKSTVLKFQFQVRGSVADGADICTSAYIGANPNPFFNTVGQRTLFCFQKGVNGFTLMSDQQMNQAMQQMQEAAPPKAPSLKK